MSTQILIVRGFAVLSARPAGYITIAGPYRPGSEDWMLFRAINDVRSRPGIDWCLAEEKAAARNGGFNGISICRKSAQAHPGNEAGREATTPQPSNDCSQALPQGSRSMRRARPPG